MRQQIDLTKRSQAERLAIANSLTASVLEEYPNGTVDSSTIQVAGCIQANVNRIVWKLNALNNPNTLKALDCVGRQDITLYECDPAKNISCKKSGCYVNGGPCKLTRHEEYRKDREKI